MRLAAAVGLVCGVIGALSACDDDTGLRESRAQVARLEKRLKALEAARSPAAEVHTPSKQPDQAPPTTPVGPPPPQPVAATGEADDARVQAPPLVPTASTVRHNSARTAELTISVRNQGKKPINAFRFNARLTDTFDQPVLDRHAYQNPTNVYFGVADDIRGGAIRPGEQRSLGVWPMFGFDNATQALIEVTQVHFTDDSTWTGVAVEADRTQVAPGLGGGRRGGGPACPPGEPYPCAAARRACERCSTSGRQCFFDNAARYFSCIGPGF